MTQFFGSPEEMQAHMERQQMEAQDVVHRIEGLFDSLDKEEAMTLRYILQGTMRNDNYAPHLDGQLAGMLSYKFGVCAGCGVNHAEELLGKESAQENTPDLGPSEKETLEKVQQSVTDGIMEKMKEYGLHFPTETEAMGYLQLQARPMPEAAVICNNCKMVYQSLSDRMRRDPGVKGCEGCQHQAKWG